MLKIVVEQFNNGAIKSVKRHIGIYRSSLVRRITVLLSILYLLAMVNVGQHIFWDPAVGLTWSSSGYALFPIPIDLRSLGYFVTPMHYHLSPFDIFIYMIFVGQWFWAAWMLLGVLYIMIPIVRRGYTSWDRFNSKPEQKPSDTVGPVSRFTKSTSILTVLLSTGTFIFNLAVYGPLLLSIVLGLSIVVFWILFVEDRKVKAEKPKEDLSVMLTRT